MTDVGVLGGGIGGLTAAHELAERGFNVTVFEANDRFGGNARSMPIEDLSREDVWYLLERLLSLLTACQ